MTDQRYSIAADELVSSARIPVGDQVEVQAEPRHPAPDRSAGLPAHGDGMSGGADGD